MNRAIDLIMSNTDGSLRLDTLAREACFSPHHFHRIFKGILGETPAQFVKRVRLERALRLMTHIPNRSLTTIALECGFSSSSDFSRAFKQRYGDSPRSFDLKRWQSEKREYLDRLVESENEHLRIERLPVGDNPDGFVVELVDMPKRSMAYIRVLDPFREGVVPEAAKRLIAWAERMGAADNAWYGYMWDDPSSVELKDCRYDVAVESDELETECGVGFIAFPKMRVATLRVRGGIDLEMRAFDWLYRTWLPRSGYVPDDHPCFEAWAGRPFAHGVDYFELDIHLPVRLERGR